MQDYRRLHVWKKAHEMTLATYKVAVLFTAPPAWPLRDQVLRAVISVPSNIAEGAGRGSDADFKRFLHHALGSLNEVEYDLLLARDLGFMKASEHSRLCELIEEVRRMLSGLMSQLRTRDGRSGGKTFG
jgi:four helix bundle protein